MKRLNAPHKQRGVATVLIVLLLAMSLTVAVLTGIQYNRSAQEQSISLHSQTAAQALAWETAEIVRLYFDQLRLTPNWLEGDGTIPSIFEQIETATNSSPHGFELGLPSTITAQAHVKKAWINPDGNPGFKVEIAARSALDSRAESTARLEIVLIYNTTELELNDSRNVISFGGDTDFSGGIKVYVEPGQTYDIAVDGNVTLGGVSINADGENGGISSILSTRSIKFTNGSSMFFDRLQANCDIQLAAGAAGAELVYARNNICVANPKNPEGSRNLEVKANGSVYLSGGNWGNVLALAGQGEHQACPSAAEQYCAESNMQPERPGIQFGEGVNAYDITTHGFVDSQGTNTLKEIKSDQGLKVAWGTSFIRALLGGEGCIGEEKVCEKHEVEIATAALPQINPALLQS